MRNRRLNLEQYGISQAAYDELKAFCLQYGEKLAKLGDIYSLKSVNLSSTTGGHGSSSPTERAAEIAAKWESDIEEIRQSAKEADAELEKWIILNATTRGNTYSVMHDKGLYYSEQRFREARRKFFYLLAKKRGIL